MRNCVVSLPCSGNEARAEIRIPNDEARMKSETRIRISDLVIPSDLGIRISDLVFGVTICEFLGSNGWQPIE